MPLLNARGSDEAVLRCRPSCDDGGAAAAAWEAAVLSEAGGIAVEFRDAFRDAILDPVTISERCGSEQFADNKPLRRSVSEQYADTKPPTRSVSEQIADKRPPTRSVSEQFYHKRPPTRSVSEQRSANGLLLGS